MFGLRPPLNPPTGQRCVEAYGQDPVECSEGQLQQLDPSDWPLLMSGALLLTIPAVGFFLVHQRLFLTDERLGSIRGR